MNDPRPYTPEGKPIYSLREIRDNNYMWACHEFTYKISQYCHFLGMVEFRFDDSENVHKWLKEAFNLETTRQPTDIFDELIFKYSQLVAHYFDTPLPTRSELKEKGKHQCLKDAIDYIDSLGWSR